MRFLLCLPPLSQLNAPYPSTPYLTAFLRAEGHEAIQLDLSLELVLELFSRTGFRRLEADLRRKYPKRVPKTVHPIVAHFLAEFSAYENRIDAVVRFLQGKDPSLALQISKREFLPEGPRFQVLTDHPDILDSFGELGIQDRAKYIATLFLDDVADLIREGIDNRFQFSKYGESLAASQISFSPLRENLEAPPTLVDEMLEALILRGIERENPDVVGFSVPFPGNMYGALRAAKAAKAAFPKVPILMGGGFVNTELREVTDPRFFDYVDYLIFDDGELPLNRLIGHIQKKIPQEKLVRTKIRRSGAVVDLNDTAARDLPFRSLPTPTYDGLKMDRYLSLLEMPNPMHRMWSDFRWNKMILAHGCYWRRCSFCDITLDYIQRFEPNTAERIVQQMEEIAKETGLSGFHFVDEAAPPALLKSVSEKIISRGFTATWWGNIRFDKQFTPALCEQMAAAGCVAVTGGLEVASPRILQLIEKGTSVEQVARVAKAFANAGVYVHAYLMYGFPTQTTQETIDSLEVVRQLFAEDCIQSGFWHRFATTVHSPVGKNPEKFGISLQPPIAPQSGAFARNDVPFTDPTGTDHDELGAGLRRALYNFMHGIGLDEDVRNWFDIPVPKSKLPRSLIRKALRDL